MPSPLPWVWVCWAELSVREAWALLSVWTADWDSCPVMMTPSCWDTASANTEVSDWISLPVCSAEWMVFSPPPACTELAV